MKLNDNLTHTFAECIAANENCMAQILENKEPKEMKDCIQANWNCSTIVASTLELLSRGSKRADDILQECMDICKEGERVCRQYNDFYSQVCADACYRCYTACEESMEMAQVA